MPEDANSKTPDEGNVGDEVAYLEHARWLLEWHERRSEAFITRASALLAFIGVLLALVLQLITKPHLNYSCWTWTFLGGCLVAFGVSGVSALVTLLGRQALVPSIQQVRKHWTDYLKKNGSESPSRDIAENFIVSLETDAQSPLSVAATSAGARACTFRISMIALAAGWVPLGALIVNVAMQA